MGVIHVSTLVSAKTKEPKVDIVDEEAEWRVQLTVAEARALALNILQAAEAAVTDGFVYDWVTKVIQAGDAEAGSVLNDFREYRKGQDAWPKVVVTE